MGSELLVLMLLAVVAGLVFALVTVRRVAARQVALDADIERAVAAAAERDARLKALEQALQTQQLTEQAVATGTALVREVHKGIADIPFNVLEAIPATREGAKALRGLHNSISDGVYGALAGLNKAVGRELRKGLVATESAPPALTPEAVESAKLPSPAADDADPAQKPNPAVPPAEDIPPGSRWG